MANFALCVCLAVQEANDGCREQDQLTFSFEICIGPPIV